MFQNSIAYSKNYKSPMCSSGEQNSRTTLAGIANPAMMRANNRNHKTKDKMDKPNNNDTSISRDDLEAAAASVAGRDETTITASATTSMDSYDFVDYTPPTQAKILPPAKYKLCLLIDVLVLLAVWLADEANVIESLMFRGWLSPQAALFLFLVITVFVLTYGALDLFVAIFTFRIIGSNKQPRIIGIGAWLKAPRSTWMYRYQNFLVEVVAIVIRILEDGFRMFDAPPCQNDKATFKPAPSKNPCVNGETTEGCRQKVLKIEHRICPTKIKEYQQWEERIAKLVSECAIGLIGFEKQTYTMGKDGNRAASSSLGQDEVSSMLSITGQDGSTHLAVDPGSAEKQQNNLPGILQVIKLTFQDIDCLNEWMVLPRRKFLMDDLQPFLVVPDVIQIRLERELPDAFTDLLIRQGESVPNRPPLKWKVSWLTTIALYISIQWVDSFMEHYYQFWGLDQAHPRILDLVNVPIVVAVNTYILVPLLLFFFDHWVKRTEVEAKVTKEPWRTVYDGFSSIWWKLLLTAAYYGGMAIAWIVIR